MIRGVAEDDFQYDGEEDYGYEDAVEYYQDAEEEEEAGVFSVKSFPASHLSVFQEQSEPETAVSRSESPVQLSQLSVLSPICSDTAPSLGSQLVSFSDSQSLVVNFGSGVWPAHRVISLLKGWEIFSRAQCLGVIVRLKIRKAFWT